MSEHPRSGEHDENLLDKFLGLFQNEPQNVDELSEIIDDASQRAIIDADAQDMIKGILEMSNLRVRDIMVPKSSMIILHPDDSLDEVLETVTSTAHSRYPVLNGDRGHENEAWLLLAKDLIKVLHKRESFDLRKIMREALIVPESKKLNLLLKDFQDRRYHLALVVDEFGGISGLVTIEDILELIVGKIGNEYGDLNGGDEEDIREVSPNVYLVRGMTSLVDFNEYFDAGIDTDDVETIAGVVISQLGHLPKNGETLKFGKFFIKVLNVEHRRINMLQIRIISAKSNPDENDGKQNA